MTETDPARPSEGAGATPRPWHSRSNSIEDKANNLVAMTHRPNRVWDDAALIVAAVNDYDRLRKIEEAARELDVAMRGLGPMSLAVAKSRLREALAAAPSRPVEREEAER